MGQDDMRVAIVHYWLVSMRGGERVLEQLCGIFPEAEILGPIYLTSQNALDR